MVVEPETARRRADVLEGGSVVLMAAPDQPGHKISLDFEKVVHVKNIKLQGTQQGAVCVTLLTDIPYSGNFCKMIYFLNSFKFDNFAVRNL